MSTNIYDAPARGGKADGLTRSASTGRTRTTAVSGRR